MLLGISENLQEDNKNKIKKQISVATTAFLMLMFLPLVLYALFHFNLVSSKSAFSADIQEPVAKVITSTGVGTAFLINPTTLLTARHVVEQGKIGDEVDLIFEQSKNKFQTKARIKYFSSSINQTSNGQVTADYFLNDVAVLEVTSITDIDPLVLGESEAVNNLDDVVLIGYPNGDYSITRGNINSTSFQGFNLFKLDASANPGNSGGPCILKEDNTVIGILVGGSGPGTQGENVALKINDVKKILQNAKITF